MKKGLIEILGITLMAAICLTACADSHSASTATSGMSAATTLTTPKPSDISGAAVGTDSYVYEPDFGEGYQHILLDRKFDLGFGCEWSLGKKYTKDSGLKQGNVTHYADIGKPFYIVPNGLATRGEPSNGLIASSGLEDSVYWQFEEGVHKQFTDESGVGPYELNDHRIVVNSTVKQNDQNRLIIEQYNDYLHQTYPEQYPESDPLPVKTIDSDRNGKIIISYNSYNDISNSAYSYGAAFAENTWPHLLLTQTFAEPVDLAKFSSIDFSMDIKVNRTEQINTWPRGASDRYDQPTPPAGAAISSPESTLQTYFFIRTKKDPYSLGAFVGIMLSSSNDNLKKEFFGLEQHGIDFYRINLGHEIGKSFGLEGEWLNDGDSTTVKVDLVKYLDYVLTQVFDNDDPRSKWYGIDLDDIYLSYFNIGYEYIGNWDCEFELSNLYARGTLKDEIPEEKTYIGKWHLQIDEFNYSTGGSSGNLSQIVGAATNSSSGALISNWSGSYSAITANYLHLKKGWVTVNGYKLSTLTCKIYATNGALLREVDCTLHSAEEGVFTHVINNMGYDASTVPRRFNGNVNEINLSAYSGQTVTVVYEVGVEGSDATVIAIILDVTVP